MSPAPDLDAVVVGSGPNGLAAALRLARAGHRVTVLEAQAAIGGGTRTEALTLPGFQHDICSTVHPLALASPAFRALDLGGDGLRFAHSPLALGHPLDGRPGETDSVLVHQDVAATQRELGRDGAAWGRVVGAIAASGYPTVSSLLDPFGLPPRHPVRLAAFGVRGIWSNRLLNAAAFREPRTRAMFTGISAHAALPLTAPITAGFGLLLASLAHLVGWPVAVGGSRSIADAMARRLQQLGGRIETNAPVRRLSDLPSARLVMLDVTPRQLLRMAADDLPPRYARALWRYRYAPGAFKMDWALDGPVPWRDERLAGAATVHLGGSEDEITAAERAVSTNHHPSRPFVLFVQATVADPSRAPTGKHTGWAYCHVPNGSTVDMSEAIERQVERFAPGFRDRVLARHIMGPAALETHDANEVGGDFGGGLTDLKQFVARPVLRLNPWATPLPGVYLCSASTPPGGGVHGMCGWNAAGRALRALRPAWRH